MSNNQGDNQNYITKMEHDPEFRVKKVSNYVSDGDGNLVRETIGSKISSVNSTSTLLTASSTFTGEWEDVSDFPSVVVAAKTDQDGTFLIQFSPDGVNLDSSLTRYYRTNQIEAPHRFTVTRQYCRIVFTNTSASDQTFLRLQTMLCHQTDSNDQFDL